MSKKFILIESNNFEDFPIGGTLSFSKHLISIFKEDIKLVGLETGNEPCGIWRKKIINGIEYDYFGIARYKSKKNFVPIRLKTVICLFFYRKKIFNDSIKNYFTQSPHFLFVLSKIKGKNSLCFRFAGTGNSISLSKYKFARIFGNVYERFLFKSIKNGVDCVLASADKKAIKKIIDRSKGKLNNIEITQFPTRFNPLVFFPANKMESRDNLGLPKNKKIISIIGRLADIKGWKLALESFELLNRNMEHLLIFVGEGEARIKINEYSKIINQQDFVLITGKLSPQQVSLYINSSDVILVTSFVEGWPTVIVESMACGKNVVSTDIGGAGDLIENNVNGFVINERAAHLINESIKKSFELPDPNKDAVKKSIKYSINNLKKDLSEIWFSKIK
ncbi:MAG: glycosyltransferase family 4 protein [Ignavibacteriales bacterium]|nr:glycosyltransferase family 4 protein [Ignavibacteriales bacterium]